MIEEAPEKYFRPPYVGVKGWVGIELRAVSDEELQANIHQAWQLIVKRPLTGRSQS